MEKINKASKILLEFGCPKEYVEDVLLEGIQQEQKRIIDLLVKLMDADYSYILGSLYSHCRLIIQQIQEDKNGKIKRNNPL